MAGDPDRHDGLLVGRSSDQTIVEGDFLGVGLGGRASRRLGRSGLLCVEAPFLQVLARTHAASSASLVQCLLMVVFELWSGKSVSG